MTEQTAVCFQVEEVFAEENDLLVLSLAFASPEGPLDIVHIACGRARSGSSPPPAEDLLYVERTDQELACDGRDVLRLADRIELGSRKPAADALSLPAHTHTLFRFDKSSSARRSDHRPDCHGHGGANTGRHQ
ncbi:MAG: hypothetical protein J7516_09665 [Shinella sp.]|nr:hypothetical protein [Shinella sp.]